MKIDERVNYMRMTLGMIGIPIDNMTAEIVCELNDLLMKKKNSTTLRDITKIQTNIVAKYTDLKYPVDPERTFNEEE